MLASFLTLSFSSPRHPAPTPACYSGLFLHPSSLLSPPLFSPFSLLPWFAAQISLPPLLLIHSLCSFSCLSSFSTPFFSPAHYLLARSTQIPSARLSLASISSLANSPQDKPQTHFSSPLGHSHGKCSAGTVQWPKLTPAPKENHVPPLTPPPPFVRLHSEPP